METLLYNTTPLASSEPTTARHAAIHASLVSLARTAIVAPASTVVPPSPTLPKVKTLSLQDYLNLETRPRFLADMRESLKELGTFYIKDHGVSPAVIQSAMTTVRDYFGLPLEEKKKMHIVNSRHFRGYKLMGEEITNDQVDHREQLQFAPEGEVIESFVPGNGPDYQGLQGPNLWPTSTLELLPMLRPCIIEYMEQLEILSQHIMEAIALSLDLDASYFRELFGQSPYYRLKAAKYPSVSKEATIGCGAHKDTGFLTVLLQDMVGGLQGQDPASGEWMDTRPIPDTFIVTMGEAIERLTGGQYHATVHRVLNNTSGQDRYSIPFFFDPSLNATIPSSLPSDKSCAVDASSSIEDLVAGLNIHDGQDAYPKQETSSWSNGAHIFETVHRCHPEVYSRWYKQEL